MTWRRGSLSVLAANIARMPSREEPVWLLLQRGVLSRQQALSWGLSPGAIRSRIEPGGAWQTLLPGVYQVTTGLSAPNQLQMAALLYAGSASVITGVSALHTHMIRAPQVSSIEVLVPHERKRRSCKFVVVHRTRRLPTRVTVDYALRFAPPARAVADAVRGMSKQSEVRAVVASAVQQRKCSITDLAKELNAGPTRGSAGLRAALTEVAAGIRSVPEGDFRQLIIKSGLPQPLFNETLLLKGQFLAIVDAWWPEAGLVAEIDSREWHLLPDDWEKTMARHARITATGIRVIHISPRQLRTEPARVLENIVNALRTGGPVPGITSLAAA